MLISNRPVSIEAVFSSRCLKMDLEATQNRPVNPTGPVITQGARHDRVRHHQSFVVCIFHLQIIQFIPSLLYFVVIGIYTFTGGCFGLLRFSAFAMMEPERTRSAQTLLLQLSETNLHKSRPLFSPAR